MISCSLELVDTLIYRIFEEKKMEIQKALEASVGMFLAGCNFLNALLS